MGLAVFLPTMLLVARADAQESTPAAKEVLEEVVVTAERRDSTVLKTPISITAVSGAELQERGVLNMQAIAEQVPGIGFRSNGPGQTELDMRGLNSAGGFSPTVGFYLDDIPLTAPSQSMNGKMVLDPDLYDLSRLEILRGPQGTLYGSGSMGGTIRLMSNQPQLDGFHASTQVGGSNTSGGGFNSELNGMLNIPLVDNVAALRVVGTDKHVSGWIDRIVADPYPLELPGGQRGNVLAAPVQKTISDSNAWHVSSARASLLLQQDRLSITPALMYQRMKQDGPSSVDNPPGSTDAHYQPFDVAEPITDTFKMGSINAKYDFDNVSLASVSSYWKRDQAQTQDVSENQQFVFGFPGYKVADGGVGPLALTERDLTSQFTQELRLASTGEKTIDWLVGAFYSSFKSNTQFNIQSDAFVPAFGTAIVAVIDQPITVKQTALFGEASYRFTSRLKGTLGLRRYKYDSHEVTTSTGIATITGGAGVDVTTSQAADSGINPKATLSFTPNDDNTVYGTIAKGFRPGAGNQPIPLSGPVQCLTGPGNLLDRGYSTGVPKQFKPDSVWNYEVGQKARVWDGRATINSAVYYEKWKDVQQQIAAACGYPFTDNGGDARIYGLELEVAAKLSSAWSVSASGGYTNAEFSSARPGTGVVVGQRMLFVPPVTASAAAAYTHPLTGGNKLTARASYRYVGPRDTITYTRHTRSGYYLADLRFGVENERWSAFAYVSNLTNRRVLVNDTQSLAVNVTILDRVAVSQPRTLGVTLAYQY